MKDVLAGAKQVFSARGAGLVIGLVLILSALAYIGVGPEDIAQKVRERGGV